MELGPFLIHRLSCKCEERMIHLLVLSFRVYDKRMINEVSVLSQPHSWKTS